MRAGDRQRLQEAFDATFTDRKAMLMVAEARPDGTITMFRCTNNFPIDSFDVVLSHLRDELLSEAERVSVDDSTS